MFRRFLDNTKRQELLSNSKYRDELLNFENKISQNFDKESSQIQSDFILLIKILFILLKYFLLLPINFVLFFLSLFSKNKKGENIYFRRIFFDLFLIFYEIRLWFFQSRATANIFIFLIFCFILQNIFLNQNRDLLELFMTNPNHLFSSLIYTNLTSIFLHADIIHLLTNLIVFLYFARVVEKYVKNKLYIIFIVAGILSNLISNLISLYFSDIYFSLGASGAIAGIILLAILINPFWVGFLGLPIPIFIVGWGLISLDIFGITNPSQINHLAHICGYLSNIFLFIFLDKLDKKNVKKGILLNIILFILFLFSIYFFNLDFNFISNYF